MDLRGRCFLVVGLGASGRAAARLLAAKGARVMGNDARLVPDDVADLEALGVELHLGEHDERLFTSVDHIVVSPGVPSLPALEDAARAGVPIASEIEMASWFIEGTVIGVTGTNGKSTVTSLVGAMARKTGRPTFVGGNLGRPLTDVVGTEAAGPHGLVVVELSSFQLERVDSFRAHVAVLLNVTEDHLDRYATFAEYAAAKGRIFAGQHADDHAIVPADDALCRSLAGVGAAKVHTFGPGGGVGIDAAGETDAGGGPYLCDRRSGLVLAVDAIRMRGGHNLTNACAATLAARLVGVSPEHIAEVLRTFPGLPHRMEHVCDLGGVAYFDDSKATNVGACVAALRGFEEGAGKVVLLAGGKDKGGSYEPLLEPLARVGRAVVTLGQAAPLVEAALGDAIPWQRATDMEDAVARARQLARSGDSVVLAPACSSFDSYHSYAERGEAFKRAVKALEADECAG